MSEPRFHASVTDADNTTPITKEALDSLRAREGAGGGAGREADRGGLPDRAGQSGLSSAAGDQVGGGFRTPPERSESPFAARYVDPAFMPDSEPSAHRSNGRASSPAGVPTPAAHVPSGQRPGAAGTPPTLGPQSGPTPAVGGDRGRGTGSTGYGGYGGAGYGGYQSGETPTTGYGSQYASPAGTAARPGGAAGLGGVATGGFVGGSTIGTAAPGRPGGRGRSGAPQRPARRARLLVKHVDPWSTLKFSLVVAVALFFVWLVAVGVLYGVLDGMGVFNKINSLYDELSGSGGQRIITPGLVLGTATLVGAVNIVLMTALATIGSFVYNICSDLVGGIEITLAERE
jgi:Transmembrane domain of unknown function (DUF3566)